MLYSASLRPGLFAQSPAWDLAKILELAGLSFIYFSLPLMTILLCHEMGHYLLCLRYGIDASPPFFMPFIPDFSFTGTLGAFIRIREPFERKDHLFDVGVGGPIAGFLATLPVLVYGVLHTRPHLESVPPGQPLFGYPLGITLAQKLLLGHTFTSAHVYEHPSLMAAWIGLLVTALNLLPAGQLDGGHAVYALFGRRQVWVTYALLLALAGMGFFYMGWWIWLALIVIVARIRHPRTPDEDVPLDGRRKLVALAVLGIFILSFSPVPLSLSSALPAPPHERHGTVVHERDLHRRAEPPRLDAQPETPKSRHVAVEERPRELGLRGPLEAGTPPA